MENDFEGDDPILNLVGTLLETWNSRYTFRHNLEEHYVLFSQGYVEARVDEVSEDRLRVTYQRGASLPTSVDCTVDGAAGLIEELMAGGAGGGPSTDYRDSPQTSKPKSRNISEYLNSPEGRASTKREVERQESTPSRAFPGERGHIS